jgi:hypothetical protein
MKILTNIDLAGNQLLNVVVQVLASAPSSPAAGRFYFDSVFNKLRYYNGSAWVDLSATSSDASLLNGQAGTYYLARANHTGVQTASTISDFDTQVRTSRLDQMATPTADVALGANKITGVADPTNPQDAATKAYVDAARQGLDVKASVRAATTANITLSGAQTIDGVSIVSGDRVLVKAQTTGSQNGIYVAATGSWTRATDADTSAKVTPGMYTFVEEGTTLADTGWLCSNEGTITLATTALTFVQFSSAGVILAGTGLTKTGNTIALDTGNGYGVRKAQADVGDNSSTALTITHNLSTRDLAVQVYNKTTPYETVFCDVERTSTSDILLRFASAPTTAQYRVVVLG